LCNIFNLKDSTTEIIASVIDEPNYFDKILDKKEYNDLYKKIY
jgi:hypothetical protein